MSSCYCCCCYVYHCCCCCKWATPVNLFVSASNCSSCPIVIVVTCIVCHQHVWTDGWMCECACSRICVHVRHCVLSRNATKTWSSEENLVTLISFLCFLFFFHPSFVSIRAFFVDFLLVLSPTSSKFRWSLLFYMFCF